MKTSETKPYYIPCAYLHSVRLQGSIGRILSWWFLMLVPTLGYYLLALPERTFSAVGQYALLLLAVVPYYELGYMLNDTFATRRETHPSLRLSETQTAYFYQHTARIVGLRIAWTAALLGLYGFLGAWSPATLLTLLGVALLLPVFCLYNRVRGLAAVVFYPVLISWRYLVFLLPLWGTPCFLLSVLLTFLSYPLLISLERYSMPQRRYGVMARLLPNEASKQTFRAAYYILLLLFLTPLWRHFPAWSLPIALLSIYRSVRLIHKQ